MKEYKERHVYFFKCEKCGKARRQSFKRKKAKEAICRSCRGSAIINPNQSTLFDEQAHQTTSETNTAE